MISEGADVNAIGFHGESALYWASEGGHIECMKVLIANGSVLNKAIVSDRTPLSAAAEADQWDTIRFLLDHGPLDYTESVLMIEAPVRITVQQPSIAYEALRGEEARLRSRVHELRNQLSNETEQKKKLELAVDIAQADIHDYTYREENSLGPIGNTAEKSLLDVKIEYLEAQIQVISFDYDELLSNISDDSERDEKKAWFKANIKRLEVEKGELQNLRKRSWSLRDSSVKGFRECSNPFFNAMNLASEDSDSITFEQPIPIS